MNNENENYHNFGIFEFDFDISLKALEISPKAVEVSFPEAKKLLYYTTGRKFKNKEIRRIISEELKVDVSSISISKLIPIDILKKIHNSYISSISLSDISSSVNSYISPSYDFKLFHEKIKSIKPNLSNELITQIFFYLSGNSAQLSPESINKAIYNFNK